MQACVQMAESVGEGLWLPKETALQVIPGVGGSWLRALAGQWGSGPREAWAWSGPAGGFPAATLCSQIQAGNPHAPSHSDVSSRELRWPCTEPARQSCL